MPTFKTKPEGAQINDLMMQLKFRETEDKDLYDENSNL